MSKRPRAHHHKDRPSSSSSVDSDSARAAFRAAFEKRFAPLPTSAQDERPAKRTKHTRSEERFEDLGSSDEDSEDGSSSPDFGGFSDDEDEDGDDDMQDTSPPQTIEVVDATTTRRKGLETAADFIPLARSQTKKFMSSKPPPPASSSSTQNRHSKHTHNATDSEDDEDSAHKVNDLALQRLLNESHLLTPGDAAHTLSHQAGTARAAPRALRAKQLDLRVAALAGGVKKPGSAKAWGTAAGGAGALPDGTPRTMPLPQRRGIEAKRAAKEARRREDARAAGVVLERATGKSRGGSASAEAERKRRRERGVGEPSVGKFRGGTLTLGARDLRELTSTRERGGGGRGRGGRGRGGKRR